MLCGPHSHKVELIRDVNIGGNLAAVTMIVLFRILRGGSEVKRRIQPWTSGEQNLSSSGIYLEESQGAQPWREEVSRSFS